MAVQVRYDKQGRRLPDTGHGCGCRLCEEWNATRYERRQDSMRTGGTWSSLHRGVIRVIHTFAPPNDTRAA